jgi:branched-chain amino acid transport system substrate-binding protein
VTTRRTRRALALLLGSTLLFAACADESTGGGGGNETDAAAPAEVEADNTWALDYTGGTEGPADESLEPITIGYINQEGGVPSFPEATAGIEAAVEYVNAELGGVDGHPLQLETCLVQAEEDGQRCATQMRNDDSISFVMTGTIVVGNGAIYSTLGGQKPVIIGFPGVAEDFIAQDAYAFTPGAVGVVTGMSTFVGEHLDGVHSVAVVHSDNAAGRAGAESILMPGLAAEGITDVTLVPVADTATGPDLVSAIQAAGGDSADLFIPLVSVQGCIATYDALQSLGVSPSVLTTGLCYGTPMTNHLADLGLEDPVPDGWYYADLGYSYFQPDEDSGMETYLAEIAEYGPEGVEYTGFAGPLFANLLTMVQLMNGIGADNITPDAIRQAAQDFHGPMMLVAGPMDCGFSPIYASLCGHQMGVQQYSDGSWSSIANALNDQAIETAPDADTPAAG